jgi:hypothetical protein
MDMQTVLAQTRSADLRQVRFLYCDHSNIIRGKGGT